LILYVITKNYIHDLNVLIYSKSIAINLKENVDIKVSFHSFRHKLTKELLDSKKIDPNVVKKILGHKNLSSVMDIYHEITEDEYINEMKEYYDNSTNVKL
jgi:integrase